MLIDSFLYLAELLQRYLHPGLYGPVCGITGILTSIFAKPR